MLRWGEQELREKDGEKGNPDDELSLVTSANAVKLILLGDSAVGKTKCVLTSSWASGCRSVTSVSGIRSYA
jgi:hypothetical protein